MDNSGSLKNFAFGFLLLGLVLGLPSGITAVFDGLPWTGGAETLTLAVIIPCLLILGRQFLSLRFSIVFLCALLLLKTILFIGSPSGGWLVKVHPNLTQNQLKEYLPFQLVEGDSWVRTYATMWNKEASGILKNPWTEKLDFPLDWMLVNLRCGVSGQRCLDEVNPVLEIDGILVIPEGKKFSLMAEGVQEGNLLAINEEGKSRNLIPAKNRQEATQQDYQFQHLYQAHRALLSTLVLIRLCLAQAKLHELIFAALLKVISY